MHTASYPLVFSRIRARSGECLRLFFMPGLRYRVLGGLALESRSGSLALLLSLVPMRFTTSSGLKDLHRRRRLRLDDTPARLTLSDSALLTIPDMYELLR